MKANKLFNRISTFLRPNHRRNHHHHLRIIPQSLTYSTPPSFHHLPSTFPATHPPVFPNRFFSGTSTKPGTKTCWNCGSGPTSELFLVCDSCRCIQLIDYSIDYFHLFGLEKKFDIEEGNLDSKYKDWQKKLHPDLVHSKSETEREYAAEQSSRVIDAYRTLGNALSRAIYLMKLQGVHVDEEQTVSDPELLAEIMELRESVEDAADSQALKQIQAQVLEKLKHATASFASAFNNQDTDDALNYIRRMTYYTRANEEILKRL